MTDHSPQTQADKQATHRADGGLPVPPKPRWWVYVLRALALLVFVLALLAVLLFYAVGTQSGTKFLLEKIALETGTELKYTQGNLKDGVWVSDVKLAVGDDLTIHINKAYVQLGWRAILARQVHLVDSQIDTLNIINNKPSTGEPFDYATIDLPITLSLDNTGVKQVNYQQVGEEAVHLHDIHVKKGKWSGTKAMLNGAKIRYDDVVSVDDIHGFINLTGDYPLDATAKVRVSALDDVYVGELNAHAQGTLKRTTGTLTSTYNKYDVQGEFVAQGLDKNSPFSAKLHFDKVVLPYATDQNITLSDGMITADGVIDRIELRINTDLTGKDIPAGRYHGRGVVRDGGMDIPFLQADTAGGILTAKGSMEWSEEFELHATLMGNGYQLSKALPKEYQEYGVYLPKHLTGELDFDYWYLDKAGDSRFDLALHQKDGEQIRASLRQSQKPNAPWRIRADWQNLVRTGVPNLGNINSTHGKADIVITDNRISIDADGQINELSVAPKGNYAVKAHIDGGEIIHLNDFAYQGVLGDLSGRGRIDLAIKNRPLTWQMDLHTNEFMPNAYFDTPNQTPVERLSGNIVAQGRMRDGKKGEMVHDVVIDKADLSARLNDQNTVAVAGSGRTSLRLVDGKNGTTLDFFTAQFDGNITQSLLPQLDKFTLNLDAHGNLDRLHLNKLDVYSDSGNILAKGQLGLNDGIDWDMTAQLDQVDTTNFAGDNADLVATITGNLSSKGRYRNDTFQSLTAQFDGNVVHDKLPQGRLNFDVSGQGQTFDVTTLSYDGVAGKLSAQGRFDMSRGYAWDFKAQMANFDVGSFVKDVPSDLTGSMVVRGHWQDDSQFVAVDHLDVAGTLRNQPLIAKGSLVADLVLPKDLPAYLEQITPNKTPKNLDELIALRGTIDNNARRTQGIIKQLSAKDFELGLGDNHLSMNGEKSELTANIAMNDLGQVLPSASGTLKGGVILMDDGKALPTLYIDLVANGIRTADVVVQDARALGKIVNLGNSNSQLLVEVKNIIAMGKVINSARLDFHGTEQKHALMLNAKGLDNAVNAKVEGSFDRQHGRYRGVLGDGVLETKFGKLTQKQPSEFSYDVNDASVMVAAHCWQATKNNQQAGTLCLQDKLGYSPDAGNVNLVVQNLDTSVFSAFLPQDIHWQSTLNGKVQAHWQQGAKPSVNAVLYSDNGRVGLTQDGSYVQMPYERVSLIAQSVDAGLKLRADIAGSVARGYADVVLDPYKADKPISGALLINDINLAVIRPFFPNFQTLAGMANVSGGVGGTLSKPLFYGKADLHDGRFAVAGIPINLANINATAKVNGTHATLSGDFLAGEGKGKLSGEFDWSQDLQARLRVSGEELDVSQPPMVVAKVSPDVEVIVRPKDNYINIQGVVSVPSAIIRPPEATAEIVSESGDVTVLDRRATGNIDQVLAVSAPWSINADIGVDLGDDVVFRGLGAKLPLAGALHLTQSGQGAMKARGVVQVSERTTIDGIGQNLELNYAQIRFNGDVLNPRLSIEGEKQIEGQTVGVRVKGTANSPDITVFNDAGLSEQQAMNALVTGRITESADSQISEQGFRSQVTNNLAAAGLNLGFAGTRNITNQIGQAFGLESLTLDASGNSDDTSVSITGYLSPDLYIRYGVGLFNAESTLSMRYQLTRRIYIEAASATENTVDVIYRWKF